MTVNIIDHPSKAGDELFGRDRVLKRKYLGGVVVIVPCYVAVPKGKLDKLRGWPYEAACSGQYIKLKKGMKRRDLMRAFDLPPSTKSKAKEIVRLGITDDL